MVEKVLLIGPAGGKAMTKYDWALSEIGGAWKLENQEIWRLGSGPRVAQGLGDSSLHW